MEFYVTIKYDFYRDNPHPELSEPVEDIEVGVFRTLEAAKLSIEEQYAKEQEEDEVYGEDQWKINWVNRKGGDSWKNDFDDEVVIRKMILSD